MTPTASGKTLCYALPVLQALAEDPSARALLPVPDEGARPGPGRGVRRARAGELAARSRRRRTTATRRRRSGRPSGPPGRSWSPTRTCSTRRSSPITRSGSSSSSRSGSSSSTSCTRTAACSAATSRTSCGGCCGCAPTTARTRSSCARRRRSGTPAELAAQLTGRTPRLIDRNGAPAGARHVLLVDPPLLDPATGARGSALTHAAALGAAVPPGRPPDDRVRAGAGRGRDHPDRAPRGAPRAPRAAIADPRLPRRLPAHGAARDRARPARRRDPRRRLDERARARRRHRRARRLDPRRLPGLGRGHLAAARARRPAAGGRASASSSRRARRSTSTSSTTRSSCSRARRRRPGSTRTTSTCCSRTSAARRSSGRSSRARCSARARSTTSSRSSREEGHVRQAGDGRWYWSSENFPASEVSLRTAAPENVVIIDTTPDRPRVIGETDLFSAQVLVHTQAIYLHESVAVPRRQARLGRAQGLRPPGRRRLLHVRQPGGDAQAARRLRDRRRARRPPDPRRGDGREPRHAVQEAQVRDRRERRLGPDRPARAGAPDDRLLADGGGRASVGWRKDDLDVALLGAGPRRSRRSPRSC